MTKYPNCPKCNSNQMRKHIVNKVSYWKCWMCGKLFSKDLLFEVIEVR
ncbi:MAG TPA: hypothetical protein VJ438_01505 [Candidatus Nanoarchaeia archaeon]|nr:hypothetical protein [Candidatus Nanoarchaeia archaeon]